MSAARVVLRDGDHWVRFDGVDIGGVYRDRHIVRQGGVTTVCGASANAPDAWEPNTTKRRCPDCVTRYGTRNEERGR